MTEKMNSHEVSRCSGAPPGTFCYRSENDIMKYLISNFVIEGMNQTQLINVIEEADATQLLDIQQYLNQLQLVSDAMQERAMQFQETHEICTAAARRLFEVLPGLLGPNFTASYGGSAVIQVMISNSGFGLSVAYPIDANEYSEPHKLIIETALIDANRKLVYRDELDYNDIRRWSNIEELVAEFNRVRALLV